ncbi:MAG: SOS response-associated peptidase [Gemmataceae bacterium]
MCGRYTLAESPRKLAKRFDVPETPELPFDGQRYNIAPTQQVPIVRQRDYAREMVLARWGLIPSWAKDMKIGNQLINARADTVATKPSFRAAFKSRRCLIPADGFYEWQKTDDGKQPFHIHMKDKGPFAFAGLWEWWLPEEGEPVESCAIITTDANELMAPIHNRMPVILAPNDYATWLKADGKPDALVSLLNPFPADLMEANAVSKAVNSPRNQGEKLIEPA